MARRYLDWKRPGASAHYAGDLHKELDKIEANDALIIFTGPTGMFPGELYKSLVAIRHRAIITQRRKPGSGQRRIWQHLLIKRRTPYYGGSNARKQRRRSEAPGPR